MSKAFVQEPSTDAVDDAPGTHSASALPAGQPNYITAQGYQQLRQELLQLIDDERPKVVEIVHWAASNGDRSENGDYLYGKKRLREIDRRIRYLTKRLELAQVVDPSVHYGKEQIFFGATVVYQDAQAQEHCVTILGVDEATSAAGEISWISPLARALIKAHAGETVRLQTPLGVQAIEILQVNYPEPATKCT